MTSSNGQQNKDLEVLLNDLILHEIFRHICLQKALQFRLVCKTWKLVLDRKVSKDGKGKFCVHDMMENSTFRRQLNYFKVLKISNLILQISPPDTRFSGNPDLCILQILEALEEFGPQINSILSHKFFKVETQAGWEKMMRFLSFTPNLKSLNITSPSLPATLPQGFCHLGLKSLQLSSENWREQVTKEFVESVLKCFPNLETNFDNEEMDLHLPELLKEKKGNNNNKLWGKGKMWLSDSKDINKGQFPKFQCRENEAGKKFDLLKNVPAKFYPLTRMEFGFQDMKQADANNLTILFKKFSTTLESLTALCTSYYICEDILIFEIPSLPKLRKLRLGLPEMDGPKGKELTPTFLYDFGKSLTKNFPLLEHFSFVMAPIFDSRFTAYVFGSESWKIWESVIPLEKESGADLSPLRFLKSVDLLIPKVWKEEDPKWLKKFVDTYLQIFGHADRRNIQDFIDWID